MTDAAIYFHPDGYATDRPHLLGRHVAGESFLIGFLRHSGARELVCLAENQSVATGFFDLAARYAPGQPTRLVTTDRLAELAQPGCLFVPGANADLFAWPRRRVGQRLFSLCGVTHTTAEDPPHLGRLLVAPLQPWDAVVCTSEAARSSVEAVLLPYADYLRSRLGATQLPMPRLPVIPLGIDTARFRQDGSVREEERQRLGIGPDDIAVLYVGRLNFPAKAHPLPMYLALQRAAERTGKPIHLIQAGWFPHPAIEKAFTDGARRYCPSVRVLIEDGRKPEVRDRIWAAADIFTSLADNVQETFGLTPVEAMAAGLPGVITDWNGYRETLRHGVDGFRVPTLLPPPNAGPDIADHYARGCINYDTYVGQVAQLAAVDVEAAAEAYRRLIEEPDLRRTMGRNAQAQAARYDWSAIIPRYRELWRDMAELRATSREIAPWNGNGPAPAQSSPTWPDPFAMFASYPSETLSGGLWLVRPDHASLATVQDLLADPLNSLSALVVASPSEIELMLDRLAPPGGTVDEVLSLFLPERRHFIARTLVMLMKFDQLRKAG
jgi:glycosyltransferase involved in cell wall biosynthesis